MENSIFDSPDELGQATTVPEVFKSSNLVDEAKEVPLRDGFQEWVEAAALWQSVNTSRNEPVNKGIGYDEWLIEKKVKIKEDAILSQDLDGYSDVGDSCCFGTRTVQTGRDCAWKLHGGI